MHAENRVAGRQLGDQGRPGQTGEAGESELGALSGVGTLPLVLPGQEGRQSGFTRWGRKWLRSSCPGAGGGQRPQEAFLIRHHLRNQIWCVWVSNPFILLEKVLKIIRAPHSKPRVQPPASVSFQCSTVAQNSDSALEEMFQRLALGERLVTYLQAQTTREMAWLQPLSAVHN